MESTGHSSMQDLSRTSTQGCAMMYVTSDSSSGIIPVGLGPPSIPVLGKYVVKADAAAPGGPPVSPAGRRLSAQLDGARWRCACITDPAFGAGGGPPLVASEIGKATCR